MHDLVQMNKSLNLIFHELEHIHLGQRMILAAMDIQVEADRKLLDSVLNKIERVANRIQRLDAATP